jgi:DNA repair exonuclease SbcCD ATPase subunit
LQEALARNKELEEQLSLKSLECESLHSELETFRRKCTQLTDEVFHWQSKQEATYHSLHMEHQTAKRGSAKIARLKQQKEILVNAEKNVSACFSERSKNSEQALSLLKKANNGLRMELLDSMAHWKSQLDKCRSKLETANSKLSTLQKEASR